MQTIPTSLKSCTVYIYVHTIIVGKFMQDKIFINSLPYSAKWWRGKLLQIGNFKNLVRKTLVNCNELSLSCSIKTCHFHAMLNLKPQPFILSSRVVLKWCAYL